MKSCARATLLACLMLGRVYSEEISSEDEVFPDLKPLSGEYSFNASCSDADAHVTLSFRKANDKEGGGEAWRVDGTMTDRIRGVTVEIKGALVSRDTEDGAIVVDARFVGFRIKDKKLTWVKGVGTFLLEKIEPEKAEEKK